MYIVRDVLIAKPGSAGKLAKLMKQAMEVEGGKFRVMLDFVSEYNKIVIEHEVATLAEFEKDMNDMKNNPDPKMMELMKGYQELYSHGYREILKVVD